MEENKEAPGRLPTSQDVADRAGVSRTVVSYALNGNHEKHMSEQTRSKVLKAARELGYYTQSSARALRKGHSEEICFIVDLPPNIQRTELVASVQKWAFRRRYTPVVYFYYGLPEEQQQDLLMRIFARRPMGIIATRLSMTEEHTALARRMGVENIILYSDRPTDYPRTVLLPTRTIGRLAAQHLLERGHRRLCLVRPADVLYASAVIQRLEGMHDALVSVPEATVSILPLHFSVVGAHEFVDTYLTASDRPTGIYAFNDEYALLLLGALADRNIQVPQDVAVVGTDNIYFCDFVRPTLTSIRFDQHSLGGHLVDILIAYHTSQKLPEELTHPLHPQLIQRSSS